VPRRPGDEVIVLDPIYATYEGVVGASGARIGHGAAASRDRVFTPTSTRFAAAVTPRTRVGLDQQPPQPDRAVFTGAEIGAIATLCRRHDLWLLSERGLRGPRLRAAACQRLVAAGHGRADGGRVQPGRSSHALPSFRLGWIVGPPELAQAPVQPAAVE
jgi:arginine:pyruvate transaminase